MLRYNNVDPVNVWINYRRNFASQAVKIDAATCEKGNLPPSKPQRPGSQP